MTITVPELKNHKPVLVAPKITYRSYSIRSPIHWTWRDYLRQLEIHSNKWINTYNVDEMQMSDVNQLMQDLYPGPYCVVETTDGFELEFDDPKEQTFWLLKNS
jgi:hypothetical protein